MLPAKDTPSAISTRTETDSLGPRTLPADALYGAQTSRSRENFPFPDSPLPLAVLHAMARLKHACATANERLGVLAPDKAEAIRAALQAEEKQFLSTL